MACRAKAHWTPLRTLTLAARLLGMMYIYWLAPSQTYSTTQPMGLEVAVTRCPRARGGKLMLNRALRVRLCINRFYENHRLLLTTNQC